MAFVGFHEENRYSYAVRMEKLAIAIGEAVRTGESRADYLQTASDFRERKQKSRPRAALYTLAFRFSFQCLFKSRTARAKCTVGIDGPTAQRVTRKQFPFQPY